MVDLTPAIRCLCACHSKSKFLFQDAYIHYLKCVQYIVQILLNDAQRPGNVIKVIRSLPL